MTTSVDSAQAAQAARRVLPYSHAAERSVLGGVLLHPRAFVEVRPIADVGDFYHPAHAAIYAAMIELDEASKPIDEVTVAEQMRATDTLSALRAFNGEAYFAELTSAVVTVENLAYHARIVRGKATVRKLIETAQEISAKGYGDYEDVEEYCGEAERAILAVTQQVTRGEPVHIKPTLKVVIAAAEGREEGGAETARFIPTGMEPVDALTIGLIVRGQTIVAARPGVGKTAFAWQAARNVSLAVDGRGELVAGIPVLGVSPEMGKEELVERLLAHEAGVDYTRIQTGHLSLEDWKAITAAASRLSVAAIWIDDTPGPTLAEIRSKVRRWHAQHVAPLGAGAPSVVLVDYLGLVETPGANREREIAAVSRGLRNLWKELNIAGLVLCQLNRASEGRKEKKPQLSDLRDSGAIEQDADRVMFLHRDAVDEKNDRETILVMVPKARSGRNGEASLSFDKPRLRFEPMEMVIPGLSAPAQFTGAQSPPPDEDDR